MSNTKFIANQYLNTLNENQRNHLNNLFERFPVKNTHNERKKLIENAKKNYPNGFEVDSNGEVDIFSVY